MGSTKPSIKVMIPTAMMREIEDIVEFLDRWSDKSEFVRDAIRSYCSKWIEEMRQVKTEYEKGGSNNLLNRGTKRSGTE